MLRAQLRCPRRHNDRIACVLLQEFRKRHGLITCTMRHEVMQTHRRTDLERYAHFPTQMRPFPEAEAASGKEQLSPPRTLIRI